MNSWGMVRNRSWFALFYRLKGWIFLFIILFPPAGKIYSVRLFSQIQGVWEKKQDSIFGPLNSRWEGDMRKRRKWKVVPRLLSEISVAVLWDLIRLKNRTKNSSGRRGTPASHHSGKLTFEPPDLPATTHTLVNTSRKVLHHSPYRAQSLGCTSEHSLIRIGKFGFAFFNGT